MTDGNLYVRPYRPPPWQQCPRCNQRGEAQEFIAGYCPGCAAIILNNLDYTTLANIWKAVDKMEAARDERKG